MHRLTLMQERLTAKEAMAHAYFQPVRDAERIAQAAPQAPAQ